MVQAVNVIITNPKGEYLLQMRDGSENIQDPLTWGFFGGGIEPDESPTVAAMREINEELGVEIGINLMTTVGSAQVREDKVVYVIKLGRHLNWQDFTVKEGAGAAFFTKEELARINISKTASTVIDNLL